MITCVLRIVKCILSYVPHDLELRARTGRRSRMTRDGIVHCRGDEERRFLPVTTDRFWLRPDINAAIDNIIILMLKVNEEVLMNSIDKLLCIK
jgi:hypothetical protein